MLLPYTMYTFLALQVNHRGLGKTYFYPRWVSNCITWHNFKTMLITRVKDVNLRNVYYIEVYYIHLVFYMKHYTYNKYKKSCDPTPHSDRCDSVALIIKLWLYIRWCLSIDVCCSCILYSTWRMKRKKKFIEYGSLDYRHRVFVKLLHLEHSNRMRCAW